MTDRLAALRLQLMASEMSVQIGRHIRKLRKDKGWNQRELAEELDITSVTNQTVSNWERGVHKPLDDTLELLAQVFGVTLGDFYAAPAKPTSEDFAKLNGKKLPDDGDTATELLADALDRMEAIQSALDAQAGETADVQQKLDELLSRTEPGSSGS